MPVRIYSLAKELKLDSKDLVDLCTKAGITGKGSALASLGDDEVDRLKAYLNSRNKPAEKPVAVARAAVAAPTATAVVTAPVEIQTVRREDYIAPGGNVGRPPVLEAKSDRPPLEVRKKSAGAGEGSPKPTQRGTTTIKMAPMPASISPPVGKAGSEPAPQKPDLKLPADAIRAGKAGTKPLSEHIRKHEQKRKAEGGQPRGEPAPQGRPAPPAPPTEGGRERPRRTGRAPVKMTDGSDFASALGGREARQLIRKRLPVAPSKPVLGDEEERIRARRRRNPTRMKRTGAQTAAPRKTKVSLQIPCTVRTFCEGVGIGVSQVLQKLLSMETTTTPSINSPMDLETVELLAAELGVELELKRAVDIEDELQAHYDAVDEDPALLETRPPVITFLGHVDHGKTSLLDKIIGINVVSGESGGITQHIRAYQIEHNGRKISFVDTPGHEAFTEMRARGANVTDIAVLVVAADDGVMPQTEEAISHARAAGVPIVVALNKIDLPGVDIQRIFQQLATAGLLPTEWGGDVEVIKTSATIGTGIDDLLETLFTIAELHDLKANPQRAAVGTCLDAAIHEGRGVMAKMIIQKGTLKVGDAIVCGNASGHVKAMYDTLDSRRRLPTAGPSMPVNLTGLDVAPQPGEKFYVLEDIAEARSIAQKRNTDVRATTLGQAPAHVTLENLFDHLDRKKAATLNIILRADVRGSIEALQKELTKLEHPEVKIKLLQTTVGGISEADVHLADASDAVIIGFNVVPDEKARSLAEQKGVQIRRYDVIYKVTDDLKMALEGMLEPEKRETGLARVLVQRVYAISRVGTIAGCRVLSGTVPRNSRAKIIRDSRIVGDYAIDSLKREKDDAREVREGMECGIKLAGFNDVKEGDVLEIYRIDEVAQRCELLPGHGATRRLTSPCRFFRPTYFTGPIGMTSRRLLKAAEAIRQVVSMTILTELKDPRVAHVTVTHVEVMPDMREAKIFVSIMGDETHQQLSLRGLQSARGFLQAKLAEGIDTRYTPRLHFVLDMGVKRSIEIARILHDVLPKNDTNEADATETEEPEVAQEADTDIDTPQDDS